MGTASASLSYLKNIDHVFLKNLESDAIDIALSTAMVVMIKKPGLEVIAEGIATEGQKAQHVIFFNDHP